MAEREAKKTVTKTVKTLVMLNPLCLKIIIKYLLFYTFFCTLSPDPVERGSEMVAAAEDNNHIWDSLTQSQ